MLVARVTYLLLAEMLRQVVGEDVDLRSSTGAPYSIIVTTMSRHCLRS